MNGSSVRVIREALGIQGKDLAARAGISAGYLTRIEAGERQPTPEKHAAIANGLGVPLDAITYPVPGYATSAA